MTQLIIVIIIVSFAFGAAFYKIYLAIFNKNKHLDKCSGCSGCALKNELINKQRTCKDGDFNK